MITDNYRIRAGLIAGDTTKDVEIQAAIDAAWSLMDAYTNRKLKAGDYVCVTTHRAGYSIQLDAYPVETITSIDGTAAKYHLDKEQGTIYIDGFISDHQVKILYRGGYDPLPADLEMCEMLIFDSVWPIFQGAASVSTGGIKTIRAGDLSITYDTGSNAGASVGGNAIPAIAIAALNAYIRHSI